MSIITLLTDFGTADGYVGEMKGVLASRAPGARLIDIAHDIAAQDIEGGRLALARYWRRFPAGTVHLAVVDPGVGGARRAIAGMSDDRFLVGPDNGLLSLALLLPTARIVELSISPGASATFHGRDIFAPAAAALAIGNALDSLGTPITDAVIRRTPESHRRDDGSFEGCVITIDRFGNAITNLMVTRGGFVTAAGRTLAIRRTYTDVRPGEPCALVGSNGLVEIAVRDGSAAASLGITRGMPVTFRPH